MHQHQKIFVLFLCAIGSLTKMLLGGKNICNYTIKLFYRETGWAWGKGCPITPIIKKNIKKYNFPFPFKPDPMH